MALALYRKYRPRTFAEVIGQEHVTEPLSQALRSGRLHHAYLFSGPRGCGKTSSARILARSLNCEQGPTPEPCGVCTSCRSLANDGAGSIDVIEIDAASHGGVDDARELREKAFFAPAGSRYKIYVIDEAHMVSPAGFNALLKLVEEPPEYVKFIFATTEPEKVLGTIRSRTHHYPFRLIPPAVLRPYLQQLTEAEGVHVEPAVFPLVVRAGGGSARDTLSVLDQLIAGAGPDGVSYARAVALLGVTDVTLIDEMCDALAAGDGAAAYRTIDRVAEAGHDPRRFASDLLERFRDLIVLQQVPDATTKGLIDGPADQLETMAAQAARLGPATLSRCADIVHNGLVEMRGTTAPRLLLELVTARMLLPGAEDSTGALLQRLERMEQRLAQGGALLAVRGEPAPPLPAAPTSPAAVSAPPSGMSADPVPPAAAGPGGAKAAALAAAAAASRKSASNASSRRPAAPAGAPTSAPPAEVGAPPAAAPATGGSPAAARASDSAAGVTAPSLPAGGVASGLPGAASPSGPPTAAAGSPGVAAVPGSPAPAAASGSNAAAAGLPGDAAASAARNVASAAAPPAAESGNAPEPDPGYYDDEPPWDDEPYPSESEPPPAAAMSPAPSAPAVPTPEPASATPRRVEPDGVLPDAPEEPGAAAVADDDGQLTAKEIRDRWNEIVGAIRRQNVRLAGLLRDALVRDFDGSTVVLTFKSPTLAQMASGGAAVVGRALYEEFGERWEVRCETAGEGGAATLAPAPRGGSSRSASGRQAPRNEAAVRPARPAPAPMAPGAQQPQAAAARPAQSRRQEADASSGGDDDWPEPVKPGGLASPTPPGPVNEDDEEDWPEVRPVGGSPASDPGLPASPAAPATVDPAPAATWPDPAPPGSTDMRPSPATARSATASPSPERVDSDASGSVQPGSAGSVGADSAGSGSARQAGPDAPLTGGSEAARPTHPDAASQPTGSTPGDAAAQPSRSERTPPAPSASPERTPPAPSAPARPAPAAPAAGSPAASGAGAAAAARAARNAAGGTGGGLAAARAAAAAAAAARQNGGRMATAAPTSPGNASGSGRSWSDGSPTEEAPYDPEYDGPAPGRVPSAGDSSATYEGFDPGDEPLDDVLDEKTARENGEQQAMRLLRELLGAEKIGES